MPSPIDPLQLPLRDIHLPPPPPWWPPAPGWWVLGFLFTVVPTIGLWWWLRRRRGALRRHALRELAELRARNGTPEETAAAAALLLRRVSLAFDPAQRHVAATDVRWLARVRAIAPGFEDEALGAALLCAPYARHVGIDTNVLVAALERWVRALPSSSRRRRALATAPVDTPG